MCLMGLIGGTCIVCLIAEFLLYLFEHEPSDLGRQRHPERTQANRQASEILTANSAEAPAPSREMGLYATRQEEPGLLIAANHSLYRRALERWFREHGFVVWTAADGWEAVQLHKVHANEIAIALLDVSMPMLDGKGTLAALKHEAPTIRCCFMTANLSETSGAELLALGADIVFEKPLLLRETTAAIWGLIGSSPFGN